MLGALLLGVWHFWHFFLVLSTFGTLFLYASHSWHSTSIRLVLGILLALCFSMLGVLLALCFLVLGVLGILFLYMFNVLGILFLSTKRSIFLKLGFIWSNKLLLVFASLYLTLCFYKARLYLEQQVAS